MRVVFRGLGVVCFAFGEQLVYNYLCLCILRILFYREIIVNDFSVLKLILHLNDPNYLESLIDLRYDIFIVILSTANYRDCMFFLLPCTSLSEIFTVYKQKTTHTYTHNKQRKNKQQQKHAGVTITLSQDI